VRSIYEEILASPEFVDRPPVLVDVGAAGGIHAPWRPIARQSVCLAFDPDDRDLAAARGDRGYRRCHVVRAIVTDRDAPAVDLHLTASPHCSSTLRPRADALAAYAHASLFDVVGTAQVPSIRLETALAEHGLERIDWLKTDSQGLDRRVFESLSPLQRQSALVVDLEPGILDGYDGEDKLRDVLDAFDADHFWCAALVARGAVRGSADVLTRYLGGSMLPVLPATERTAAGWVEIEYVNTFRDPAVRGVRDLLLGWVFSSLLGHHAFALELADLGTRLHPADDRFPRLANLSVRGIRGRHRSGLVGRGLRKLRRMIVGSRSS
jgi:FkbM family methyltransferase